ncbi:MAG: DUF5110 domain-containing protein, partial [Balneolaceae bacterium]
MNLIIMIRPYRGTVCINLSILIVFFLGACHNIPESEFYESEGIVSIYASSVAMQNGWEEVTHHSLTSKRSSADSAGVSHAFRFSFYVQQPGDYDIWILTKQEFERDNHSELRLEILDDNNFLIHQAKVIINRFKLLTWVRATSDGESDRLHFSQPGYYHIDLHSMGEGGLFVHKMHLNHSTENRPAGLGMPETVSPTVDPVLAKREQRVDLPPAWAFGVLKGGYENQERIITETDLPELFGTHIPDELRGRPEIPQFGQSKVVGLREHIEMVSDPDLIMYEVPFTPVKLELFNSNDINETSEDLAVRWIQFLTFNSLMPFYDGNILESDSLVNQHIEELTVLRNRLFPYIYSLAHLTRGTGQKPVRGDAGYTTQFFLGDAFLVAPVFDVELSERFVFLPSGVWYDYFSGEQFRGGQSWLVESPLHKIPVFVKAGAIIPYRDYHPSIIKGTNNRLQIEIYGGAPGTFRLYEDDGLTNQYKQGDFSTTAFRYFEHDEYATFTIGRMVRGYEGQSSEKELQLTFKYLKKPVLILVNETELEEGEGVSQWMYDE